MSETWIAESADTGAHNALREIGLLLAAALGCAVVINIMLIVLHVGAP